MNDFNKNMQEAVEGDSGFDPNRARSAQREVFRSYQRKTEWSERGMWLIFCLFCAVGFYALLGFILQATTTKEFVGYGMAILWAVVFAIQINILSAITFSKLITLKEIKQLRLAMASGPASLDEAAARPLRGLSRWEKAAWICGLLAMLGIVGGLSSRSNRQDDLWQLKADNRIEAHSVITLHRFPHDIPSFYGITGPVEGADLQSAALNGQPVPFQKANAQYTIQLPSTISWGKDQIELAWSFSLPAMADYTDFRVTLRSLIPVHAYSLILYVEDGSGYVGMGDTWKFNKTPEELENETEARRTLKCFTTNIPMSGPRDSFGTCGLPIIRKQQ